MQSRQYILSSMVPINPIISYTSTLLKKHQATKTCWYESFTWNVLTVLPIIKPVNILRKRLFRYNRCTQQLTIPRYWLWSSKASMTIVRCCAAACSLAAPGATKLPRLFGVSRRRMRSPSSWRTIASITLQRRRFSFSTLYSFRARPNTFQHPGHVDGHTASSPCAVDVTVRHTNRNISMFLLDCWLKEVAGKIKDAVEKVERWIGVAGWLAGEKRRRRIRRNHGNLRGRTLLNDEGYEGERGIADVE